MMVEMVISLGSKYFGLPLSRRNDTYLKLFEYMLQDMVEYQVSQRQFTGHPACSNLTILL
jgi:hypothetical protein